MKSAKKLAVWFLSLTLCLVCFVVPVCAETLTQDGIEVTLTTDKDSYAQGEKIAVTVTATNTNDTAVSNVSIENLIPDGFQLADGTSATANAVTLEAGETLELNCVYEAAASGGDTSSDASSSDDTSSEPNTDNSSDASTGTSSINSDNGTSNTSTGVAKTGDNSNMVWLAIVVLASAAVLVVLCIKKKKQKNALSLMLCVAMVGTMGVGLSKDVFAVEQETKTVHITKTISIDNREVGISANVAYSKDKDSNVPEDDGRVCTRGEWIRSLVDTVGLELVTSEEYSFDDADTTQDPQKIETAIQYGIVELQPDQDNKVYFKQDEAATREFVAYTAIRALNYVKSEEEELPSWDDGNELSYAWEDNVAVKLGMFQLQDNKFLPQKNVSVPASSHVLSVVQEIMDSTIINSDHEDVVNYVDGVEQTTLSYILDEDALKVTVLEPEKIEGWQAGEIHVLFNADETEKDVAVKIVEIREENGQPVIYYEKPALEEVVTSFDIEGIENSDGTFTPAEGVTLLNKENARSARAAVSGSVPLFGKQQLAFTVDVPTSSAVQGGIAVSVALDIKDLEYRLSANPHWFGIDINEVYLAINSEYTYEVDGHLGTELQDAGIQKVVEQKLGDIYVPLGYGFNASFEVKAALTIEGKIVIKFTTANKSGFQYTNAAGFRTIADTHNTLEQVSLSAEMKVGANIGGGVEFCTLNIAKLGLEGGLSFGGEYTKIDMNQFCVDGPAYVYLNAYAQVGPDFLNEKFSGEVFSKDRTPWSQDLHFEETGLVDECTRGSGDYQGNVMKADNPSEAINRAEVQVFKDNQIVDTTYTDSNGKFVGIKLPKGSYKIQVSASGFIPYEQNFDIVGGQTTKLQILMNACDSGTIHSAYAELLRDIHDNPSNYIDVYESDDIEESQFAIVDINQDGIDDLVVFFGGTMVANMRTKVWTYDENTQSVIDYGTVGQRGEFYMNGLVKVNASHNHSSGYSIWPYFLYQYDESRKSYIEIASAYCVNEDADLTGTNYNPADDTDNDGVIYYFNIQGESTDIPLTLEEYTTISNQYIPEDKKINMEYASLTVDEINKII